MCGLEGGAAVLAVAVLLGPAAKAAEQLAGTICATCANRSACLTDAADRLHDVADVLEGLAEREGPIIA